MSDRPLTQLRARLPFDRNLRPKYWKPRQEWGREDSNLCRLTSRQPCGLADYPGGLHHAEPVSPSRVGGRCESWKGDLLPFVGCVAVCGIVYGLTAVAHGTATVLAILVAVSGVFWLVWNDLAAIDPREDD